MRLSAARWRIVQPAPDNPVGQVPRPEPAGHEPASCSSSQARTLSLCWPSRGGGPCCSRLPAYLLSSNRTGGPGSCAFLPRNVPHAWKNSGNEPGRVVFLYTPAGAGRFVEEMLDHPADGDLERRLEEAGWEVLGPSPL